MPYQPIEKRIELAPARFIQPHIHSKRLTMSVERYDIHGEPEPISKVLHAPFKPAAVGDAWGARWETTWFKFTITPPEDWVGREVEALIDLSFEAGEGFGREGLVFRDGVPITAVNRNRQAVRLGVADGSPIEILVEAAANPQAQWFWQRGEDEAEKLMPDYMGKPLFALKRAELALVNEDARRLDLEFRLLSELMEALPADSDRRGELKHRLNEACRYLLPDDASGIPRALAAIAPALKQTNASRTHTLSAVGHAHIDTAWCWPLRETVRKCARTFATMLDYMERFPEFKFSASQPIQYAWMKAHYPEIWEGIKKAVARGQWEVMGSMWIEADCNLSSGESLVRQLLYGKEFFKNEFGVETRDLWLPDVFGYAAALPQILVKAEIDEFLTQKISWNDTNKFPHHTFWWEGIDGTRIFSHFPPGDTYNGQISATELRSSATNFAQKDIATRALIPFGFGDGGGGPTLDQIGRIERLKDLQGMPRVEFDTVRSFFSKAKAEVQDVELPVWTGELYLELHRGTLTSQAETKRNNRKCEFLLQDTEMLVALQRTVLGNVTLDLPEEEPERAVYDVDSCPPHKADDVVLRRLDRAWKLLLLNQFHDILPGSSIQWVYRDADRDYATIRELVEPIRDAAAAALADAMDTGAGAAPVLFNTLGQGRRGVVRLADGSETWVDVPSCGYAVVERAAGLPEGVAEVKVHEENDGVITLENGLLRVTVNQNGQLTSVYDLVAEREVVAEGESANQLTIYRDLPNFWNAWDIESHADDSAEVLADAVTHELVEASPMAATVRVRHEFGNGSSIDQRITLRAGSARIDFNTDVDWNERHRLLRAVFPVDIRSSVASYETQFGHVERPTHRNTSWDAAMFETCAHRWLDVSEPDYGVALLNESKYGHTVEGNRMRITLLKGAVAPDPDADLGKHSFCYALFPHEAGLASVIEQAADLNVPLIEADAQGGGASLPSQHSFVSCDREGFVIDTLKLAEDGNGVVIRGYEALRTRGPVGLTVSMLGETAQVTNLLENPTGEAQPHNGAPVHFKTKPFEIHTLRVR
ncbi:alpha-mannosidase [Sulfuriroseicoccus oceanibius]|uniref:Alpha-mannosidase n=1 Tax=Sulfuriroseicoccus oceanibius TaxID=2707525 RepID=A0A6B3LBG1_9BACT|nr:glycoside hydrolase family 38 C-terminal domain-containing protein [Sulfuriroseicoccus oceanibius]QQL45352.1 alpha-mannosidase [Sulfuriroseicoccus oceanibius]